MAIGTTLRNIGLGALIATTSFSVELVAATVLTYFLIQFVITTLVRHLFRAYREGGDRMTPLIFSQFGFDKLNVIDYISLIAATTNAFNGALLARRPDHYKHFTLIGVIILAYAGGIGGGIVRDVLVNKVPSPLINPWYLILCFIAAALALMVDYASEQRFKDGLFQFMTAFSLPWYAIVGAQAALAAHLGYAAAVLIGIIATTAGRWIIDVACNVVPKQLVRGEFFVTAAALDWDRVLPLQSDRSGFR